MTLHMTVKLSGFFLSKPQQGGGGDSEGNEKGGLQRIYQLIAKINSRIAVRCLLCL